MEKDTPIRLASLTEMTPLERETLLEEIRERRLAPVHIYEQLSTMKAEARKEQLEQQWSKALEMFKKDLKSVDKVMERLEARSRKLRAMEMEIEQL